MALRILFFGRLREIAGVGRLDIEPVPTNVAAAIEALGADRDGLRSALTHPSVRVVADHVYVDTQTSLDGVSELAFLPPVSGG